MTNYAYLVDWRKFAAAWRKDSAADPDWFWNARDDEADWVRPYDLWCASPLWGGQAAGVYDLLREHVPARPRRKLDALFGAFFWPHEVAGRYAIHYVQDLIPRPNEFVYAGAMRPATVRRYLAKWDEAAFERMRPAFRADALPDWYDRVTDFDKFERYAVMWVDLLRTADATDRGVVVDMC